MKFKFAARVIAQLGAELISSDDIAVYELIKNSFDAGAAKAILAIEYLVEQQAIAKAQQTITNAFLEKPRKNEKPEAKEARVRNMARELIRGFEPIHEAFLPVLAARVEFLDDQLDQAATLNAYVGLIGGINQLVISDSGHGMTKDTLERSFLTIGTTYRYLEHQALSQEEGDQELIPPAGEKGIGRLSAMRLGNDLEVHTWNKKEKIAHLLRLDWRLFGPDADLPANEIEIDYREEPRPEGQGASGTKLQISDLQSPWDREKTKAVAAKFFSRFIDPFTIATSRNVDITWNRNRIEVPGLSQRFLQESQAGMKGILTIEADQRFTLTIDFWYVEKETKIRHDVRHVYSSADFDKIKDADIADIGPFDFELHHFNRLRIAAIPGLATRNEFRDWLNEWTGGLMLYRDGLRVMPYGRQPDDDWLELDRRALRRGGFRVNRIQTIGRVRISRRKNPRLLGRVDNGLGICEVWVIAGESSPMPHEQTLKSCASSSHSVWPLDDTASRS